MSAMAAERDDAPDAAEPWSLPEGWAWAKLSEVANIVAGQSPPSEHYNSERTGLPFFQGKSEFGSISPTPRKWCEFPTKFAQPDDVLISVRAPVGPTNIANEKCGIGRGLAAIQPHEAVTCTKWLLHYLRFVENRIAEKGTGTTFAAITTPVLKNEPVPIAPPAEQLRVVARIDELFAEIAEGEAALERARSGLDTWRRALLKAAVTGELTRGWREANKPNGTASDFLAQIRALKASRKHPRPERTAEPYDSSLLPNIPEDWLWVPLAEFVEKIEAGLNVKAVGHPPDRGEIGIVKISAVTWGEFDELASKTLLPGTEYDDAHVIRPGDFLISRANTLEFVGAPVIVKRCERRLVLSDKVLRLRLLGQADTWIEIFLKSPYGRQQIESFAQGNQLSMRNISQDNLRRIVIPLLPEDELRQVEKSFGELFAGSEETIVQLGEIQRMEQNLRQSILKSAFEGRLVPQDPSDEPASFLLARLRAEAPSTPRRARGRKVAS
jgi:type I restriction enzyme S subunit